MPKISILPDYATPEKGALIPASKSDVSSSIKLSAYQIGDLASNWALSGDWESTWTTVYDNSATWGAVGEGSKWVQTGASNAVTYLGAGTNKVGVGESAPGEKLTVAGTISAQTGNSLQWVSTHTSVNANSAIWNLTADLSEVAVTSGGWNTTKTTVDAGASDWDNVYSTTGTGSAYWDTKWLGELHEVDRTTITVTVATKSIHHRYYGSGSSSGFQLDGKEGPYIQLVPGKTYRFDQSDSTNSGHPLRLYFDAAKTTEFTTGRTTNGTPGTAGAYTELAVTTTTPSILYYQCSSHDYMGNQLEVLGSAGFSSPLEITNARPAIKLADNGAPGAAVFEIVNNDAILQINNTNTDIITLLTGGNVGIGTTTPTEALTVAGTVSAQTSYQFPDNTQQYTAAVTSRAGLSAFTSSGTWVCPAGITHVIAKVWGGGGGGATPVTGGGGGYAAVVVNVTAGSSYNVVVGSGGTKNANGNAGDGGTTTFKNSDNTVTYASATGGSGGYASVPGYASSGIGTVGSVLLQGGYGNYTSGGGSNDARTQRGGTGAGGGGAGGYSAHEADGGDGMVPGGGGGAASGTSPQYGGDGGAGMCIVEW